MVRRQPGRLHERAGREQCSSTIQHGVIISEHMFYYKGLNARSLLAACPVVLMDAAQVLNWHETSTNTPEDKKSLVGPEGFGPATRRIQVLFLFGYGSILIWRAIPTPAVPDYCPFDLHFYASQFA